MTTINRSMLLAACLCLAVNAWPESKRVYVYSLPQQYWDVETGDTLGEIAESLLPADNVKQQRLMRDIVELNPGAFINGDPDRLRANIRLWLPNAVQTPVKSPIGDNVTIEYFEWGSIKRVRP